MEEDTNMFYYTGRHEGRLQKMRLPWVDFASGNTNLETEPYPRPERLRR